jgi:hypothetical protein
MSATDEALVALRREMQPLLETAMENVLTKVRGVLEEAEQQNAQGIADVAEERTKGLAEVAEERAKALAEVEAMRTELSQEIEAMRKHKEAQEGRVELNIGGYRFQTSVQTLRRIPHTFFDAYFSGRYAQDVCADGSIFVDRDGVHFSHILEYMRDGNVSVADPGARPSVSLLRALKREFGFYCIELTAEKTTEQGQAEMAFVIGGRRVGGSMLSSMERFDALSGQWSAMTAMSSPRAFFGACVVSGELYAIGGFNENERTLSSVEKYTFSTDTWISSVPMPFPRSSHAVVAVGSAIYVLGGFNGQRDGLTNSVFKFDVTQGTWSEVAPMPEPRFMMAVCAIGNTVNVWRSS